MVATAETLEPAPHEVLLERTPSHLAPPVHVPRRIVLDERPAHGRGVHGDVLEQAVRAALRVEAFPLGWTIPLLDAPDGDVARFARAVPAARYAVGPLARPHDGDIVLKPHGVDPFKRLPVVCLDRPEVVVVLQTAAELVGDVGQRIAVDHPHVPALFGIHLLDHRLRERQIGIVHREVAQHEVRAVRDVEEARGHLPDQLGAGEINRHVPLAVQPEINRLVRPVGLNLVHALGNDNPRASTRQGLLDESDGIYIRVCGCNASDKRNQDECFHCSWHSQDSNAHLNMSILP